jgi:hypothetical protein
MSNITISDMHSTDFKLLSDSESYMRELSDEELNAQRGGLTDEVWDYFFVGAVIGWVGVWVVNLIVRLFD